MTRNQVAALAFIGRYSEANGVAPDLTEIATHLGLKSRSNAHRIVCNLEEFGLIRRWKYRARSIEIIEPGEVKLNPAVFDLLKKYAAAEDMSVDGAVNQIVRDVLERAA